MERKQKFLSPPLLPKLQKANEGLIDGGIEVERRKKHDVVAGGLFLPEWGWGVGRRNVLTPLSSGAQPCATYDNMIDSRVWKKKERKKNGASLLSRLRTCPLTVFLEAGVSSPAAV